MFEPVGNEMNDTNESVYELALLLNPKINEEEAPARLSEFKTMVEKAGAEFIALGEPVLKNLAYMMTLKRDGKRRDFTKSHFGWVKFALESEALAELETTVKKQTDVVRYMITKTVREDTKRAEPIEPVEIPEELQTNSSSPTVRVEEEKGPVSEEKLDEALEEIII